MDKRYTVELNTIITVPENKDEVKELDKVLNVLITQLWKYRFEEKPIHNISIKVE